MSNDGQKQSKPDQGRQKKRRKGMCLADRPILARIKTRDDGRIDPDTADADWSRNTGPRPQGTPRPAIAHSRTRSVHHRQESVREEPREAPRLDTGLAEVRHERS